MQLPRGLLVVVALCGCTGRVSVGQVDGGVDAACAAGALACADVCVDPRSDPSHCGTCETACGATEVCSGGACQVACVPGTTPCGRSCVDLQSDPRNCSACGVACPAGQRCSAGACKVACDTGLTDCSGACVSLATDRYHCGTCDHACGGAETCIASVCEAVCTPNCSGRECGPDGCSGQCQPGCGTSTCLAGGTCCDGVACGTNCCGWDEGCLPSGACCAGTVCGASCCGAGQLCAGGACCDATWARGYAGVAFPAGGPSAAMGTDGLLYLAGTSGTSAYVAAVDTCGAVVRDRAFVPGGGASATGDGLAVSGNDVFVVGTMGYSSGANLQDGLYARLDRASLTLAYANPLWGSDGLDEAWAVAVADNGSVWVSGTANYDTAGAAWAVEGDRNGDACGWGAFGGGGVGRGLAAPAGTGRAYLAGATGGKLTLAAWPTAGCWATGNPTCPSCTSPLTVSATIAGAASSEGRAVVVVGGHAYVAGFADMGAASNGYAGVVVDVDLASGQPVNTFVWNPTSSWDVFLGITTDGAGAVYVVGAQGWDGATVSTATAAALKLTLPGLVSAWQRTFSDADYYGTAVLDGSGALYLVGSANGAGQVRRCLEDGTCS